ncbi:MAG: glycoside hydrolase family 99-like domain-containing protein [Candidatus Njordarchaeia archaeon]
MTPPIEKDSNPPLIEDFNWSPTKVVWDKVYDIEVSFTVEDDKTRIKYAELRFIPVEYEYFITDYGMRPEDYPKVFPPDEKRIYELKPLDGEFDERTEEFSVNIKNITGGREYKILIIAKDEKTTEYKTKTPYIRQYENFGRQLYEKGIIVSTIYEPWDHKTAFIKAPGYEPLLGGYNPKDDIVQWKHIDWAGYAGINVFFIDLQYHWWPEMKSQVIDTIKGFLKKDNGIKIAYSFGGGWHIMKLKMGGNGLPNWAVDLSDPYNKEKFLKSIHEVLNDETILKNKNYYRVNGNPVLYIWDEGALYNEYEVFSKIKKEYELFLISEWLPKIPVLPDSDYTKYALKYKEKGLDIFDAYTGWIGFHDPHGDYNIESYLKLYQQSLREWKYFTEKRGKYFIPSVAPGFDNNHTPYDTTELPLPRSPKKFETRLRLALRYVDLNHAEIEIDTWNDFSEWSYVEPDVKDGFAYLNVLLEVLHEFLKQNS